VAQRRSCRRSALNVETLLRNLQHVRDVVPSQHVPVPLQLGRHIHRNDISQRDKNDFWHLPVNSSFNGRYIQQGRVWDLQVLLPLLLLLLPPRHHLLLPLLLPLPFPPLLY